MFPVPRGQISNPRLLNTIAAVHRFAAAAGQAIGRIGRPVGNSLDIFLDAVLPQGCASCGLRLPPGAAGLCTGCTAALPGRAAPRCRLCAWVLPTANGTVPEPTRPDLRCAACTRRDKGESLCFVLCDYASPIDQMVHALKFGRRWALGNALGTTLGTDLREPLRHQIPAGSSVWVCAVPLGPARLVERGFNQSELIARGFVRALNAELPSGQPAFRYRRLLRRTRDTPSQSLLGRQDRQNNLRGAFAARSRCDGATVVVVDDVMTTGATLAAAQDALRRAGADPVFRVALARAA